MFTPAQQSSMIQATGGVEVRDIQTDKTTYGHFERVSMEVADGEYAAVLTAKPSVVIPDGIFSAIGPRKGIGRTLSISDAIWAIVDIVPGDTDGGLIRLILAEG